MDDIANLSYRVDTRPLERVRKQLKGIATDARSATSRIQGILNGGRNSASAQFGRSSNSATSQINSLIQGSRRAERGLSGMSSASSSASRALETTARRSSSVNSSLRGTTTGVGLLTRAFQDLRPVATAALAAVSTTGFVSASEQYKTFNALLRTVTDSTEEYAGAQEGLVRIADDTRSQLDAVTKLYVRIAPALEDAGQSQLDILRLIETANQAIKISGGTAQENLSAIQQFAQGLGQGILNGDELKSILENAPALAFQIAKGLEVPVGLLKKLGEDGELTSDRIIVALNRQENEIAGFFNGLPVLSGQAWTLVRNQAVLAIGRIDERLGLTSRWSSLLVGFAGFISDAAESALEKIDSLSGEWDSFRDNVSTFSALPLDTLSFFNEQLFTMLELLRPLTPYIDEFALALGAIALTRAGLLGVAGVIGTLAGGAARAFRALRSVGAVRLSANAIGLTPVGRAVNVASLAIVGLAANWKEFSDDWERIELEQKEIGINTDDLDIAQRAGLLFRDFWDGLDFRERFVDVTARGIIFARDQLLRFQSFVNGLEFNLFENNPEQGPSGLQRLFNLDKDSAAQFFNDLTDSVEDVGLRLIAGVDEHVYRPLNSFSDDVNERVDVRDSLTRTMGENWEAINAASDSALIAIAQTVEQQASNIPESAAEGIESTQKISEQAAEQLGQGVIDKLKEKLNKENQFFSIGVDAGADFANGLNSQQALAINLANDLAESGGSEAFQNILKSLNQQTLELTQGEAAAKRYELAYKSLTQTEIDSLISVEAVNDALKDNKSALEERIKEQDRMEDSLRSINRENEIQRISLIQGAEAARIAALEYEGYSEELSRSIAATERATETQSKLQETLFDSIRNADSIRDVFNNLGDFFIGWIKDQIALFAANKLVLSVGGVEGVNGLLNNISGQLSKAFGISSQSGSNGLEAFGGAGPNVGGGIFSASNRTSSFGGIEGGLSQAGAALFAGAIGSGVADALGGNEVTGGIGSAIGLVIAGPVGAAVGTALGGAFGTSRRQTGSGFSVDIDGSGANGQSFDTFSRRRSFFRGTQRTQGNFRELDDDVQQSIDNFFDTLQTGVISSAEALGAENADRILDALSVSSGQISGKDAEEELAEFLETTTRDAYRLAYDNLGRGVQTIISDSVDLTTAPVEELERVFAETGFIAGTLATQMQAVGLNLTNSFQAAAFQASGLVDALGGIENAQARLALFQSQFVTDGRVEDFATGQAQTSLAEFNLSLGRTGAAAIDTRSEMVDYIDSLTQTTVAGREATAAAFDQLEAIIAVEDAYLAQQSRLDAVAGQLNRTNDLFSPFAAGASQIADNLIEAAGGLDQFNSLFNSYYDNFFTEEERRQFALQDAATSVKEYNRQLGLSGSAAIDTADEYRAYIDSLQTAAATGNQAAADQLIQALELQDSMKLLSDETNGLEDAFRRLGGDSGGGGVTLPENVIPINDFQQRTAADERNQQLLEEIREIMAVLSQSTDTGNAALERRLSALIAAMNAQTGEVRSSNESQNLNSRELANALARIA